MTHKGKIIKGIGGFYYVATDTGLYECRARGVFRKNSLTPMVGDDVDIDVIDEEKKTAFVITIHDRRSELIRPAVSNTDQAIVVFSCKRPDPNLGLLDRFLINMQYQDLETIIVISKADIDDGNVNRMKSIYERAGYKVLTLSSKTGEGLEEIKSLIKHKTTVLSGPSGVGKSTLINNLVPGKNMETGSVSEKIGRGKNTTRHTELIQVDQDTFIMDTPGYSSLQVMVDDEKDLRLYMREMLPHEGECKFTGCVHLAEPKCAVKEAVSLGEIAEERYNSYKEIYETIKSKRKW